MYDKKKIITNQIRALKSKNQKVSLFFHVLFREAIQRLGIHKKSKYTVLEIYAKNKILKEIFNKKKINCKIFQTVFSEKISSYNKRTFIHDIKLSMLKKSEFDFCISIFPVLSNSDLQKILESIHRVLCNNGKFVLIFHSMDSCINLKNLFYKFSHFQNKESFLPCFDMLSLGNQATSLGFKNVVVDKSKYLITSKKVGEIWSFIRDLGESNYTLSRNKKSIKKSNYISLCKSINNLPSKNGKIINEISVIFLIGTKQN